MQYGRMDSHRLKGCLWLCVCLTTKEIELEAGLATPEWPVCWAGCKSLCRNAVGCYTIIVKQMLKGCFASPPPATEFLSQPVRKTPLLLMIKASLKLWYAGIY